MPGHSVDTAAIQLLPEVGNGSETRNVYLKCHTTKGSFEDFRALNKTNCGME